jgi:hypothetical protein
LSEPVLRSGSAEKLLRQLQLAPDGLAPR